MRKFKLLVDNYEIRIIIKALNDLKAKQLNEERSAEAIDELLMKVIKNYERS